MKKIIQIFIVAASFTACNSNSKSDLDTNKVMLTDTSRMYKSNVLTDTGSVIQTTALPKNNVKPVAGNNVNNQTSHSAVRHHVRNSSSSNRNVYSNNTSTTSTSSAPAPARRRGWSHAAKDATIGGVGGAVAGAVIDKKHGQGAIIGGVVGAAGGYILGRSKDKREGR